MWTRRTICQDADHVVSTGASHRRMFAPTRQSFNPLAAQRRHSVATFSYRTRAPHRVSDRSAAVRNVDEVGGVYRDLWVSAGVLPSVVSCPVSGSLSL